VWPRVAVGILARVATMVHGHCVIRALRFRRALLASSLLACASCAPDPLGHALDVTSVGPRDLEPGDAIEIVGSGFPMRRPAIVELEGEVRRPGEPARAVDLTVPVEARSAELIVVGLPEATFASLTGPGGRATHATFHGRVKISFAPAERGAASLSGRVEDVELDAHPDRLHAENASGAVARAKAMMSFAGFEVAASSLGADGLPVTRVEPGSRAQAAGLVASDVILSSDGLSAFALADLAPIDGDAAELRVRRANGEIARLRLSLAGFERRLPSGLLAALAIAFAATGMLAATMRAPTASFAWLARRITLRARAIGGRSAARLGDAVSALSSRGGLARTGQLMGALVAPPAEHGGAGGAAATAGVLLAVGAIPWIDRLLPGGLDLVTIGLAGLGALGMVAALDPSARRPSARRIARSFLWELPSSLALLATTLRVGSPRLGDLLAAQSNGWSSLGIVRDPIAAALVFVGFGASFAEGRADGLPSSEDVPDRHPVLGRLRGLLAATLLSLAFLGGAALPSLSMVEASPAALSLASVLLVAKVALLAGAWRALRGLSARAADDRRTARTARWALPLAALSLALAELGVRSSPAATAARAFGALALAMMTLAAMAVILRARAGLSRAIDEPADPSA
jgi:hypothetical protein